MAYDFRAGTDLYEMSSDVHTLNDFVETTDPTVVDDSWRTVATWEVSEGSAVAFGIGDTRAPDNAEGFIYFDARSDDADADGTNDKLHGRVRFVVLNSAGERVATISRHSLDQLRSGSPQPKDRRSREPYPYHVLRAGSGDIVGGEGYKVGIQMQLPEGSSSDKFVLANSEALIDGYRGSKQN